MTKKELLTEFALFEDFESNAQAARCYDYLLGIITKQLASGNPVALGQNFGEFRVSTQAPRSGSIDGKPYTSPAKTVVKFRASAPFKTIVAGT